MKKAQKILNTLWEFVELKFDTGCMKTANTALTLESEELGNSS